MAKGKVKTHKFDPLDFLRTEEDMVHYIEAAFDEAGDDPAFIAVAIGDVARARGMTELARKAGMTRPGLYKALDKGGNPSFAAIYKVLRAMDLDIQVRAGRRSPRRRSIAAG